MMLYLLAISAVGAEEIARDRWPAIASACVEAHPERVMLPVDANNTRWCLERGHTSEQCVGEELISPSVAACIGNTLGQPFHSTARVYVHGPHAGEEEPALVYQVTRPLDTASIQITGWWVDARTGEVVDEFNLGQANMFTWKPREGSLPY